MLKNMNKTTKNNMITYLMVIVVYAVIQVLVTSGSLSSYLQDYLYQSVLTSFWQFL